MSDLTPGLLKLGLTSDLVDAGVYQRSVGRFREQHLDFPLTAGLTDEQWRHEPTTDDWALNEIVCHLRDTEQEIHQLQVNLLIEREGAFLPRPENAVWANEREYLNVHGPSALSEFVAARLEILKTLKEQNQKMWTQKARHAIFGPTSFLEVAGFIANHDRLHIQQAWKTLYSL
jgi:hypothetical protein